MPELPEVQTLVNDLNAAGLVDTSFINARVYWPRTVAAPSVDEFQRRIGGKKITAIRRRGKFIVMDLSPNDHLLMPLRMSGRLHLVPVQAHSADHSHGDARPGGHWHYRPVG